MERYKNLSGNSEVISYEIGKDFIRVRFSDNSVYLYTYENVCSHNVERMKHLARYGQGLNSFIKNYANKFYPKKEL